ncbi:hypothetical protein MTsPCn9_09820 [Croceitalea sp. MTPC9]|uniref:hypothetical protein n=1 Tax=unclassified Croceitalea TaxID=2632280 RepID=UPI002B3E0E1C|nr:hypothetical protein MTsPCn6_27420 [Croceitalea sp. MTPC6]GMN16046.1 hypothetical protein MTsPCn9_09820 [Croceitalea sp. MTPC9]
MGIKKSLGIKIIVVCVVFFCSCGPDYNEEFIDFVIINESGIDIRINPNPPISEQFPTSVRSSFLVANNDAFSEVIEINTRDANFSFRTFFGTDNIEIIYGNERKVSYSCANGDESNNCENSRNILSFRANSDNRAEYIFTVNDFDIAMPCDGNCN